MKESVESIYIDYFNDVYRFLLSLTRNHHTAEDLVQETFLRAYLFVENYSGQNIKSWLLTVAYNAFIDYYRKQKRMELKKQSFFNRIFDRKHTPEEAVILDEEVKEMLNMLEELSEKQKLAVILSDIQGLSYQEAADIMNISLSNYKVSLFRGRQALRRKKGE